MRHKITFLALLLLCSATSAFAVPTPPSPSVSKPVPKIGLTARDLYVTCHAAVMMYENRTGTTPRSALCFPYVNGYLNGYYQNLTNILPYLPKDKPARRKALSTFFCIPKSTKTIQVTKTVVNYFKANEKDLQKPATTMLNQALVASYPCNK